MLSQRMAKAACFAALGIDSGAFHRFTGYPQSSFEGVVNERGSRYQSSDHPRLLCPLHLLQSLWEVARTIKARAAEKPTSKP
jgi:hypothetical protein